MADKQSSLNSSTTSFDARHYDAVYYQLSTMADAVSDHTELSEPVDDGILMMSGVEEVDIELALSEYRFYYALYKVAVPTVFCLIIVIGLVGNSLVVGVTLSRPKMRSSTVSLLLLNLATSDLLFLVVCVPFMAYHYAADNWMLGEAACKMAQFTLYVTVYVTVYTLVAIAVIR